MICGSWCENLSTKDVPVTDFTLALQEKASGVAVNE
jgi:hypothetical protein